MKEACCWIVGCLLVLSFFACATGGEKKAKTGNEMSGTSGIENIDESLINGCKAELDTYCKDVTPGEGRGLACLYAHGDKLSGRCEYALYDAAVQLERAVAALSYVVNECSDDLDQFCQNVAAGEGRLLECLEKNDKNVSARCKEAIKEVGLK